MPVFMCGLLATEAIIAVRTLGPASAKGEIGCDGKSRVDRLLLDRRLFLRNIQSGTDLHIMFAKNLLLLLLDQRLFLRSIQSGTDLHIMLAKSLLLLLLVMKLPGWPSE